MLERAALRAALATTALVMTAAALAAAVRLLPWLLDPRVPWHVALPFARGLVAIALEAALLVGWPIGWALAAHRLVERGEALAILTLGERPERTIARLWPQGLMMAALLAGASLVGGRDAREPGRVVTELLDEGRAACAAAEAPASFVVPFTGSTWLCRPDAPPRLAGAAPGALSGVLFSARAARVSGDLRRIELEDPHLGFSGFAGAPGARAASITVKLDALAIHGLPPWAQASTLPSPLRALFLALAGVASAALAALAALRRPFAPHGRLHAIAVGAAGPLAALAALRLLERTEAHAAVYALVPLAALAAVAVVPALARALARMSKRLPRADRAATE
jgi:hypothetical protein